MSCLGIGGGSKEEREAYLQDMIFKKEYMLSGEFVAAARHSGGGRWGREEGREIEESCGRRRLTASCVCFPFFLLLLLILLLC